MEPPARLSLLLLEDDTPAAHLAMEFLSAGLTEGEDPVPVDVLRCSTLRSAREAAERDRFDAFVVDLNLPDSNGVHTVEGLREVAPETPLLVLSASQEEDLAAALLKAGADGFVSKWLDQPLRLAREVLRVLVQRQPSDRTELEEIMRRRLDRLK